MILYKYRSLADLEHVLDIIVNQRLHCSTYPELNDPFEGIFEKNYGAYLRAISISRNPALVRALPVLLAKAYKKAEDFLGGEIDKIKICSLSSDLNDVRLWSYYADGHKGLAFEIDFSGLATNIYEVKYHKKLPTCPAFPGKTILGRRQMQPDDLFSHKTEHWCFEKEYRIISESKDLEESRFFSIRGRIKAIYLGTRTSDFHRKLLNKIAPSAIRIYTTKINREKIIVEPDKLVEGQEVA
jgi:hypothetical protein